MKKFDIPQMDLIRLESKSIIFTSLINVGSARRMMRHAGP